MWFSYDPNCNGFMFHATEAEAKEAAEDALEFERDEADEGWSEEVDRICWGKVNARAMMTDLHTKREDECHDGEETAVYNMVKAETWKSAPEQIDVEVREVRPDDAK
jgi:hypothetical protein